MTEPTLIDFLEARFEEREQKALDAAKWYGKDWEDHGNHVVMDDAGANVILDRTSEHDEMDAAVAALVVDNDPRFVLADVAAKRQIIELHQQCGPDSEAVCAVCYQVDGTDDSLYGDWPCKTLCLTALPFAAHRDYRPEWAPDAS